MVDETGEVLARFGPATQDWFRAAFARPTDAQVGAWQAISSGKHALVVAPTGSGKTLSAFLWAIDRIFHDRDTARLSPAAPEQGGTRSKRQKKDAAPPRTTATRRLSRTSFSVHR